MRLTQFACADLTDDHLRRDLNLLTHIATPKLTPAPALI